MFYHPMHLRILKSSEAIYGITGMFADYVHKLHMKFFWQSWIKPFSIVIVGYSSQEAL